MIVCQCVLHEFDMHIGFHFSVNVSIMTSEQELSPCNCEKANVRTGF